MKKAILYISLVGLLVVLGFAYSRVSQGGTADSINFIKSHINSRGELKDLQGDIRIKSIEDLKWYDNGKKIEIEYGTISLKFKREEFLTKDIKEVLETIGITWKYDKKNDIIRVYYNNEEISKYVK